MFSVSCAAHLRVQRWGLEAELVDVGEERSVQLLAGGWHVQTALPLLLRHNFCIAWRSCGGRGEPHVSILGNHARAVSNMSHRP